MKVQRKYMIITTTGLLASQSMYRFDYKSQTALEVLGRVDKGRMITEGYDYKIVLIF